MKHRISIIPTLPHIGRNDDTEKLYAIEHERSEIIKKNGKELAKILGHTEEEFWEKTMPEVLASTLDSYAPPTGIAAALGYLKNKGTVTFEPNDI